MLNRMCLRRLFRLVTVVTDRGANIADGADVPDFDVMLFVCVRPHSNKTIQAIVNGVSLGAGGPLMGG